MFKRLHLARDIARLNNEDATLTAQHQCDATAQPHNFKTGQLVLLNETYLFNKNVKLAPKWSGPHGVISLKGPCNAELKLQNNKKLVVHTNRLKPYHSVEKNKAEFPEEQAWAIRCQDILVPKPKKTPTPPTRKSRKSPGTCRLQYTIYRLQPVLRSTATGTRKSKQNLRTS